MDVRRVLYSVSLTLWMCVVCCIMRESHAMDVRRVLYSVSLTLHSTRRTSIGRLMLNSVRPTHNTRHAASVNKLT